LFGNENDAINAKILREKFTKSGFNFCLGKESINEP
jgi:hypothetical protein